MRYGLLAHELDTNEERIAKGKKVPRFDESLWCHCKFHRLPCRYIFHIDIEANSTWEEYLIMFVEYGMEVYSMIP